MYAHITKPTFTLNLTMFTKKDETNKKIIIIDEMKIE